MLYATTYRYGRIVGPVRCIGTSPVNDLMPLPTLSLITGREIMNVIVSAGSVRVLLLCILIQQNAYFAQERQKQ